MHLPASTILSSALTITLAMISGCDAATHRDQQSDTVQTGAQDMHTSPLDKSGFVTHMEDGRLWVFKAGSKELADFEKNGELAKHVIRPGAGPGGLTIKAPDQIVLQEYMAARDGFVTIIEDGRIWVFAEGSATLEQFRQHGELAKHVIRPGAGPMGMTVKAPDTETLQAYRYSKPGFVTLIEDGRLWIFRDKSTELEKFRQHGELAKHVIRPGAGPDGVTIKSPDTDVIRDYLCTAPGFVTEWEDGRLWVFRAGSAELEKFRQHGELAKHVIRPGAGPEGVTIKSPSTDVLDRYLSAVK